MPSRNELLRQALSVRELAEIIRRMAPGMSVLDDRARMLRHAQELEQEADRLETQATHLPE